MTSRTTPRSAFTPQRRYPASEAESASPAIVTLGDAERPGDGTLGMHPANLGSGIDGADVR